jgi:hypothetical protein
MKLHCCKPEAEAVEAVALVVVMSTAELTNYQNYNECY